MEVEGKNLAVAWIAMAESNLAENEFDENAWAFEELFDQNYTNPEKCWAAILDILAKTTSTPVIELLSAGPLELLIVTHGDKFIDRIEEEAKRNKNFRHLLGGVWIDRAAPEIRDRVWAVWDRSGWLN